MAVVVVIVFLVMRTRQTVRLWPALIALLIVIHIALPNTLGILKHSLLPSGGLKALVVEQGGQEVNPGGMVASPRSTPTLQKLSGDPLLGVGFGTQVLDKPETDALILDNQWLGTLLETGFVGALAWLWLFIAS